MRDNVLFAAKVCKRDQGTDASSCEERIASLLAIHLVSHVVDEAYIIANAAEESGQPWRYLSILKNLRSGKLGDPDELLMESKTSCDLTELADNAEQLVCSLATSTPQKPEEHFNSKTNFSSEIDDEKQGDDFDSPQSQLSKATSMFINNLFDMSDVEKDSFSTVDTTPSKNTSSRIADSISNMLYSYVDAALGMSKVNNNQTFVELTGIYHDVTEGDSEVLDESETSDNDKHVNVIDRVKAIVAAAENLSKEYATKVYELKNDVSKEKHDLSDLEIFKGCGDGVNAIVENENVSLIKKISEEGNDVEEVANDDPYEHGYLTLNRDSDGAIEEQVKLLKLDCNGDMFEVNLLDEPISERIAEPIKNFRPEPLNLELTAFASSSGYKKSSLSRRFRFQGSRLLTCLRKWWRKKNPGKFKEELHINDGSASPVPGYHNRFATLQERREFPTPSTSYWKFNTINESVLTKNMEWDSFK